MKPIEQEYLLDAPQGGDCMRAAVASVFELPLRAVPHFCGEGVKGAHIEIDGWYSSPWVTALATWAFLLGYDVEIYDDRDAWSWDESAFDVVVASGPSPRDPEDTLHAVVYGPDGLVHDPHPSGDGLAGDPVDWTVFVERNESL